MATDFSGSPKSSPASPRSQTESIEQIDHSHRKLSLDSSLSMENVYECDAEGCHFEGGFDQVASHEKECKFFLRSIDNDEIDSQKTSTETIEQNIDIRSVQWLVYQDKNSGSHFYYNLFTSESQWKAPPEGTYMTKENYDKALLEYKKKQAITEEEYLKHRVALEKVHAVLPGSIVNHNRHRKSLVNVLSTLPGNIDNHRKHRNSFSGVLENVKQIDKNIPPFSIEKQTDITKDFHARTNSPKNTLHKATLDKNANVQLNTFQRHQLSTKDSQRRVSLASATSFDSIYTCESSQCNFEGCLGDVKEHEKQCSRYLFEHSNETSEHVNRIATDTAKMLIESSILDDKTLDTMPMGDDVSSESNKLDGNILDTIPIEEDNSSLIRQSSVEGNLLDNLALQEENVSLDSNKLDGNALDNLALQEENNSSLIRQSSLEGNLLDNLALQEENVSLDSNKSDGNALDNLALQEENNLGSGKVQNVLDNLAVEEELIQNSSSLEDSHDSGSNQYVFQGRSPTPQTPLAASGVNNQDDDVLLPMKKTVVKESGEQLEEYRRSYWNQSSSSSSLRMDRGKNDETIYIKDDIRKSVVEATYIHTISSIAETIGKQEPSTRVETLKENNLSPEVSRRKMLLLEKEILKSSIDALRVMRETGLKVFRVIQDESPYESTHEEDSANKTDGSKLKKETLSTETKKNRKCLSFVFAGFFFVLFISMFLYYKHSNNWRRHGDSVSGSDHTDL